MSSKRNEQMIQNIQYLFHYMLSLSSFNILNPKQIKIYTFIMYTILMYCT